ncbi:MAG: sulfite exporter TauE/SafE family protein [Armatimonadota bacterium]|nr:sulfite exporter TauE/SafE family protein [Armatimonadota bacterium]
MRVSRTVWILLGIGFSAGFLGGLLGIGGGSLVVPALVFFLAFNQHRAHGTSLAVVLGMSLASVATYSSRGHVDWLLAVEIAAGGVIGAIIGGQAAAAMRSRTLRRVFCIFLALVGLRMIIGGLIAQNGAIHAVKHSTVPDGVARSLVVLGTGVLTGFFSSLLGIGGGTVMVPAAVLLLGVDQHTAQGVSLAAMMPTSLAGTIIHHRLGNVEFRVAKWVAAGAIIGGVGGACLASCLNARILQILFGGFLVVISALLAMKKS